MNTDAKCEKHPEATLVGTCANCGKPVCMVCFKERGYFCSDACRTELQQRLPPPEKTQADEVLDRYDRRADLVSAWLLRRIPLAAAALIALGVGLWLLDSSGTQRWSLAAPDTVSFVDIVLGEDCVYLLRSDGICQAVEAGTGKVRWQAGGDLPMRGAGFSSFFGGRMMATNGLLVCQGFGELRALQAESGAELWRRGLGGYGRTEPAFGSGRMLVVDSGGPADAAVLPCDVETALSYLLGERTRSRRLVCVDAASGRDLWERPYAERDVTGLGIAGDVCFAVSCVPGAIQWRRCAVHQHADLEWVMACPDCGCEWSKPSAYELSLLRTTDGTPLCSIPIEGRVVSEVRLCADRLLLLAGQDFHVLALDGAARGGYRLPAEPRRVAVGADRVIAAMRDGRIFALSAQDGTLLWEQKLDGKPWGLQSVPGSVYVTAGVPKQSPGGPAGPPPARPHTPHEQMLRQLMRQYGGDDEDDAPLGPVTRTLINLDPATGRERWRKSGFIGTLTVSPGGFLTLVQGGQAATLFVRGTGAVLTAHRPRNGRACWEYKIREAIREIRVGADSIFLLTQPGQGLLGPWHESAARGAELRAIRRRTWINRVRKP
ncbi:MAG: PQQ-binding-like beta-propeller repeat protein [Kiritimatiellae bacterium]|nr:PQQ-binding-like beta-propeller repeat protein [Kiritimatiellia bacterium]